MAIESPNEQTAAPAAGTRERAFDGMQFAENAVPTGSNDFFSLFSKASLQRTDPQIDPYLTKVDEVVRSYIPNASRIAMERTHNAYAYMFTSNDGIVNFFLIHFVMPSEAVTQDMVPLSVKIAFSIDEIRARFSDKSVRFLDARIIITGYQPEMERHFEMGATITRAFSTVGNSELANATISSLVGTEFNVSWNIAEARNLERSLSPHGVPPRMDIAMTMSAKFQNEQATGALRQFGQDLRPLGVIGGYVEFREKELVQVPGGTAVLKYYPVFNITVLNSVMPIVGVAALLLAAFAPTIYKTRKYLSQWDDMSKGKPNPGNFEIDPATGKLAELKNREELNQFAEAFFAEPQIAFQLQDGRDMIPGMKRLVNGGAELINQWSKFFNTPPETLNAGLGQVIETRYDGVYGEPSGQLVDSRMIDFLQVSEMIGAGSINDVMRRTLLTFTGDERDRAKLTQQMTNGSFVPLYTDTIFALDPAVVQWIIAKSETNQRLVINDPNSSAESRPLGSTFGSFANTNNMGSIVSSGQVARGLGLGSVWG